MTKRMLLPIVAGTILFLAVLACGSTAAPAAVDVAAIQTSAFQTAVAQIRAGQTPGQEAPSNPPAAPPQPTLPPPTLVPTIDPNQVAPGTYMVGPDFQAGLYEGQAGSDSCYWERLKDVSGSLDSILANDNAVGQYYVRVKDTDFAFKTSCPILRLASAPNPVAQMPTTIEPGTYLVGIDISVGTYQGQAGSDTCYWERLRDVDGGLDSIIANDNATGQFYVQVSEGDYALLTACPLQRMQ